MKRIKILDSVQSKFEAELARKNAIYPFLQKSCRSFSIPANTRQFFLADVFANPFLPRYCYLTLSTSAAAAGTFGECPFVFKPFNLQDVSFFCQNRRYGMIVSIWVFLGTVLYKKNTKFILVGTRRFRTIWISRITSTCLRTPNSLGMIQPSRIHPARFSVISLPTNFAFLPFILAKILPPRKISWHPPLPQPA